MKTNRANTKGPKRKVAATTDWPRLRRMSAASIRKGIKADPDAHATDSAFWKRARIVMPMPKEIVNMRLGADLLRWFRQQPGYRPASTPSCALT